MATLKIGDTMPDFPELPAADFKAYCGDSFADAGVIVLAFTCNHCPHVHALEERMKTFVTDYRKQGVSFVAINPNDETTSPEDDYEQMVLRARTHEYAFPYLRDADQEAATAFGATHTPEFFIFDHDRKLRYHGMFDDNWQNPEQVREHYVPTAVDAILSGGDVTKTETSLEGCTIKWCESTDAA